MHLGYNLGAEVSFWEVFGSIDVIFGIFTGTKLAVQFQGLQIFLPQKKIHTLPETNSEFRPWKMDAWIYTIRLPFGVRMAYIFAMSAFQGGYGWDPPPLG